MDNHRVPAGQAVDLSQRQIPLREVELVPAAMVDAHPNGLAVDGAIGHLRVVHAVKATAWWLPVGEKHVRGLIGQLQELLDNHDQSNPPAEATEEIT